ncbi:MAG TPA: PTPA-CTERM sorting domain-containing protein [Leptolyngbyaceae cyanobacterium]
MKKAFLTGALAAATLASVSGIQANPVQAASIACSLAVSDPDTGFTSDPTFLGLSPNAGCEVSDLAGNPKNKYSQDSLSNVNSESFFNISTWVLKAKSDENSGKNFFSPTGGKEGTFDFSALGIDFTNNNVLVTFKGPTAFNFVGYLATQATGTWYSPFVNDKGNVQNVSHMSIFTSAKTQAVPTPALLPGLVGMGVAALRKRKANAEESAEV